MRRTFTCLLGSSFLLGGCVGADADTTARVGGPDVVTTVSDRAADAPPPPRPAASARASTDLLASAKPQAPPTDAPAMDACGPVVPPAGYERCGAIEVVGGPPCEIECWRDRQVAQPDPCCPAPVHGAIFGKTGLLLEADACSGVPPSCADDGRHIQSAEVGFHFFADKSPREILLVAGGCEMRAMLHGYVPDGVAAWTGCSVAKRFRWDGARFTLVP